MSEREILEAVQQDLQSALTNARKLDGGFLAHLVEMAGDEARNCLTIARAYEQARIRLIK
ncbi:hypothetical protein [Pararhizobium mangrovi]|uniref:Uncharacterized protein n=1 Tax=Pararhizobium mangrovi TaxID=2590452 RepID=A0A506U9W9_9HYPH|nr:hypothetical protein [Pararhizobium mangrovi]TPW31183.1 hypothetical protein FJU11_03005 [Pararhizobium mangrovi]